MDAVNWVASVLERELALGEEYLSRKERVCGAERPIQLRIYWSLAKFYILSCGVLKCFLYVTQRVAHAVEYGTCEYNLSDFFLLEDECCVCSVK